MTRTQIREVVVEKMKESRLSPIQLPFFVENMIDVIADIQV